MIYLDDDPKEFAARHGFKIEEVECFKCKQKVMRDIPVRLRDGIGLITRPHGDCKNESGIFRPMGELLKVITECI